MINVNFAHQPTVEEENKLQKKSENMLYYPRIVEYGVIFAKENEREK
jgi:hypothetical protein